MVLFTIMVRRNLEWIGYSSVGFSISFLATDEPFLSLSGYGNQAPVTDAGRLSIATAGIISLVGFTAVLGLCGYVLMEIFDDFVDRFWFSKWVSYPPVGELFGYSILWPLPRMCNIGGKTVFPALAPGLRASTLCGLPLFPQQPSVWERLLFAT